MSENPSSKQRPAQPPASPGPWTADRVLLIFALGLCLVGLWFNDRRMISLQRTVNVLDHRLDAVLDLSLEDEDRPFLQTLDLAERSVVSLQARAGTNVRFGTGFVAEPGGYVATCAHLVQGADEVWATPSEGNGRHPAHVARVDSRSDLALLRIPALQKAPALPLGQTRDVRRGAGVALFGFPDPQEPRAAYAFRGLLARQGSHSAAGVERATLWLDLNSGAGCDGAPVFLTRTGEVIGMQVGLAPQGQGLVLAGPIEQVTELVAAVKASKQGERTPSGSEERPP